MAVEWARLKPQGAVELADRGIFLRGDGGCRVMLLHGLTGCPTELGYLAHWLRSRGRYHVSCPRLVNHGQPLGVLARTTSAQLYQSAKDAFFESRAAARAEGVPLVVGGLSLGANLSLMLAAEFPDDVAGAACLAPTLFYDGWSVPWYHRLIPLVDYTPFKYFTYFREDEPFGEQDDVTGPRNAQFIIEHVGSPRRELLLLKRSYHLVSADLERATVADHLQQFCGSLALPRSEPSKAERARAKIAA